MGFLLPVGTAKTWRECVRKFWYDQFPPDNLFVEKDPFEQLLSKLGMEHEERIKNSFSEITLALSPAHTQELMKQGVPVIYQPVIIDEQRKLIGKPDFLIRNETGEYIVADAKLADSLSGHPEIRLQLALYRLLFSSKLPARCYLRSGVIEEVGDEANGIRDNFLENFQKILAQKTPPETHFSHSKCKGCGYSEICIPEFHTQGELTLIYGIDVRNVGALEGRGIKNISQLAEATPEDLADLPYFTTQEKRQRVIHQARSFLQGEVIELESPDLPEGTWIHFDVELNPFASVDGGQVYLWGLLPPPYSRKEYQYVWSEDGPEGDYQGWLSFLQAVEHYQKHYEKPRLIHFSPFEKAQLRAYAQRYTMESHPIVKFLLKEEDALVDLLSIVKRSLVLPTTGYGLKQICKDKRLVNFSWENEGSGSQWSVVRYLKYLESEILTEQKAIQEEILQYNRDDVLATRALEVWLRKRLQLKRANIIQ